MNGKDGAGRAAVDRRTLLAGAGASLLAGCATGVALPSAFAPVEQALGGRIGVAALDLASGQRLGHRPDELFPLCSTFKWALAAMALAEADAGRARLDERLPVSRADLVPYAPVIEPQVERGWVDILACCAAAIEVSDNVAANLLLRRFGGPSAFTAFLRRQSDTVTRLDRYEPDLNVVGPGDPRDTTTPAAMVGLMRRLLFGAALRPESRARLIVWMERASTGGARLRGGLPTDWRAGDKTGTGPAGEANDVAFAFPTGHTAPILIACYLVAPAASGAARDATHRQVAQAVARAFA